MSNNRVKNILSAYVEGFKVLIMRPDAIIAGAGKDGNAALALLHKFISRKTRIYVPFHHYEPLRIGKHSFVGSLLAKALLYITYTLNVSLLKEAKAVFVVSNTVRRDVLKIFKLPSEKVVLTGCGIELPEAPMVEKEKTIDFLCIGRIGKFAYLDKIWEEIRTLRNDVSFHMIGVGKDSSIARRLEAIGNFVHHGVVDEKTKIELLLSSKVFIFPSAFEGWGIAVGEALSYGLPVVVWDLPVYDELWGDCDCIRKVRRYDYKRFAREAIFALDNYRKLSKEARMLSKKVRTRWEDIGKIVHDTIVKNYSQ